MRQINLKIVKASELLNEAKGSFYCEIIFKDMKFKTKPVKDKLIWDNIFELGDYRANDTIVVRLVSRRSATLYGGCSIPLREYKKCGIFEKEMSIYEAIPLPDNIDSFNKKNAVGLIFVEVIVFSPMSLNRTQSEKRMNLNIFTRFRTKEKIETYPPPTEKKRVSSKNGGSKSAIILNQNNNNNNNNEDETNGIQESQSAITFGEIENNDKKDRERKRKRRKKKSEEDTPNIESTSPREKKKERRTKSEKRESSDDVPEVVVIERERRIKRKNSKVLRRSVSLAHNEKAYSKSEPAIRRRSSRKHKDISRENSDSNGNSNIENNNNHSNSSNNDNNIISVVENNNTESEVTVVKITPLASSDSNLNKLFGVSLEDVMKRQKPAHPDLDVPHFFVIAAKIIRDNHTNGGNLKGIFRIRGKLTEVKELRKKIDNGDDFTDDPTNNVHSLSTLMKAFLRELPVPLLTFENYDKYIKCADLTDEPEQVLLLKDIVDSIPFFNYTLLKFVMQLMNELSLFPEETQMTAENLAKIISPNLIWKEVVSIDDMTQVDDALKGVQLANIMIVHYQEIFTK